MCLGLPGRIVSVGPDGDLVEVAGVIRSVDLSMLAGPVGVGDHVLVHSGVAVERMTADQAREAENVFGLSPGLRVRAAGWSGK